MKKEITNVCLKCGRSSNFNNACLYESKKDEWMCYCPTFIKPKMKKD